MSFALKDHWLWDFWFAQDGEDVHIFYLQAPKSLIDPELRHRSATVGHAVTRDLQEWRALPDALGPGDPGEFDDLATWTGSIIKKNGLWYMFYTGVTHSDDGKVQRIGFATSPDLVTWSKQSLVLCADPRWYERLHPGVHEEAWRDPWVWWDAATSLFHMAITARANYGALDARGVIGHAVSSDLYTWETQAPLSSPGEFYQLEVPQLIEVGGKWHMLFCTTSQEHSAERLARSGVVAETGTHYLTGETSTGPFELDRDDFMFNGLTDSLYAGRVLRRVGIDYFFSWRNVDPSGEFVGELSDPMILELDSSGHLRVTALP